MSKKGEVEEINLIEIMEQFTSFIKEKSESGEDDDDLSSVVPMLEGLTSHMREAAAFQEKFPSIANLMGSMCETLEEHHKKLEMLKDIIIDSGLAEERRPMTKDELAEQMLANMPKPDKGYMN